MSVESIKKSKQRGKDFEDETLRNMKSEIQNTDRHKI